MQRNTPLDYAEFLLTRSRTRCELHIFANGVKEKLASGYFKPFATHLRAAEEQFAKGNQVVVLERPSNLLKKNKVTWFTKGTLERFVRFVSTPEVLERVKSIEDELSQLENVLVTLSKTFSQNEVSFEAMDTPFPTSGAHQAKGSISMMRPKSSSGADANEADTSKVELLRAMDVRLVALKQEQNVAFVRAEAAGFDSSNMADLLDFSEHFGAERLRDACIQFITLFRKRTAAQEACQEAESPLADAASSGSDMSLESGADFEPEMEPELGFASNAKETWPKTLKSSNSSNVERRTDWDPKSALKEEKDSSTSHTSARTRSRWGPPARIQINCMEPEVLSLQDSDVSRKMEEAKHHVENLPNRDDSRQSENEMRSFQAGEGLHSTLHLEKQFSLPKKVPGIDVSSLPLSSPRARREQGDKQGDAVNRVGTFFTRLQKMAQQVEARRSSEDLGVRFTSVEMSDESPGSQASAIADSSSLFESALKLSAESVPLVLVAERVTQPQVQETKVAQGYSGISSMLQENPKESALHSGTSSSLITSAAEHPRIEGDVEKRNDSLAKHGEIQETKNESDKIGDIQEKPVSTSARRLSVQAAISLFESKKVNVGEPPTRKLVRQESLKGAAAAQSGGSTSERSVLRRWSAVGSNSFKDTEDKAPNVDAKESEKGIDKAPDVGAKESEKCIDKAPNVGANESEKGIGTGNAVRIGDTMSRNTSLKIDKVPQQVATEKSSIQASQLVRNTIPHLLVEKATGTDETTSSPKKEKVPQLAADKSSTQASRLLQNTLPYLNIAQQLVHYASDASSKPMPSAQQLVHNAPDASSKLIPSAQQQSVVSDSTTWSSDGLQKQFKQELEQRLTRKAQPNVQMDDMLPSKPAPKTTSDGVLWSYPAESRTERKEKERASMSNVVLEVRPHLGKTVNQNVVEHIMPSGLVANERALRKLPGLKEEKAEYSSAETLQIRNPKHETDKNVENGLLFKKSVEVEKESSLVLHDTSVDLYMQALVMMIDNQQQSSLSLRDEDSYKEQKGRFYEHYLRLRSARQREEPPAKRAEKEAKLKSMKETLERRKAEMEAGAFRQRNRGSSVVKEQKHRVQKSGPLRGEEEMGEGEEVSLQDQLLHESKHNVPKTKAQVPKKANLQKSASARRGMTTSTSSPRSTAKKSTGRAGPTANNRKSTALSYSGPLETSNYSPVDARRDLVRMAASVKPHGKSNGGQSPFANEPAVPAVESRNRAAVDVLLSRTADMDLSAPRKSKILDRSGETPYAQSAKPSLHQGHGDIVESFKVHQDAGPEALPSLVTQNVKPSLHQRHEVLPGVDIMKNKAFDSKHSLQKYDEEAFSGLNGYEEATHSVSEEIGDAGFRNSLELDDLNSVAEDVVPTQTPSTSLDDTCRSISEGSHCGKEILPDSLDVEATNCVFEDATSDERILDLTEVDQEKHDLNMLKDEEMPKKSSDRDDFLEKESSRTITSAEKMTAFSPSDSNSSPSVVQESTTSTYSDAVASPENSFEGHFGTVLGGAYSPKPALRMVSPLGSPLSWKSFKTKNSSETDPSHSHSSPQKWVSTATSQQPSKEPAARGFKRLLHFGRKSRASEAVSTGGGISIFTASSGDVETEEANKELMRLSSEELFGIEKSQEKGSKKDPYVFQDQGATLSLRSSISAPSSNFKPGEDDQLFGGTSSKASRSFFSLSTFRNRGSEGKSR